MTNKDEQITRFDALRKSIRSMIKRTLSLSLSETALSPMRSRTKVPVISYKSVTRVRRRSAAPSRRRSSLSSRLLAGKTKLRVKVHPTKKLDSSTAATGVAKANKYYSAVGYGRKDQFAKTPVNIFLPLQKEFRFNFDPAPTNPTFDGLSVAWKARNFVNPPYNDISKWVDKAIVEQGKGCLSVFLIPFRPHTQYFKRVMKHANEIRFFRKRVTFEGYTEPAPFAVVIVVFQPTIKQQPGKFGVVDILKETGGRKIEHVLSYYRRQGIDFDFIVKDAKPSTAQVAWGRRSFVCSRVSVRSLVERAEKEAEAGCTVVLVIPLRSESPYFLTSIIFGKARSVEALCPSLICEGYDNPSPTGSIVLVYGPGKKAARRGPAMKIID